MKKYYWVSMTKSASEVILEESEGGMAVLAKFDEADDDFSQASLCDDVRAEIVSEGGRINNVTLCAFKVYDAVKPKKADLTIDDMRVEDLILAAGVLYSQRKLLT